MSKTIRIDIRVPEKIIKEVEAYQEKEGIATRTGAFLELVRIGLKAQESQEK